MRILSLVSLDHVFKHLTICNPTQVLSGENLTIRKGRFSFKEIVENRKNHLDLSGWVALPGLINAHDHLLGSYLPRVGHGPYLNWLPWDEDLKASEIYSERGHLDSLTIYKLGYYRQILSGVTTVCDHIPHVVNQDKIEDAYVRIIDQYCLAHEVSSYELPWGDGVEKEVSRAKRLNIPFITHICEGFDPESRRGVHQLHEMDGLFKNTVLVHGISCDQRSIELIAENQSSMVWCPNSNMFMFDQMLDLKAYLQEGVNLCLGTDSPMSGGVNLLEELKFAKQIYRKTYHGELDSKLLFQMITQNPARAFNLENQIGSIEEGKSADLILIKKKSNFEEYPYQTVTELEMSDISMVVREGKILLITEELLRLLQINFKDDFFKNNYEKVNLKCRKKRHSVFLLDQPTVLKREINDKISFSKELAFFPI